MKHIFCLLFFICSISHAAHTDNCIYQASVVDIGILGSLDKTLSTNEMLQTLIFKIENVHEDKGGSVGCDHSVGRYQALTSDKVLELEVGDSAFLYNYYTVGFSGTSLSPSNLWEIVDISETNNECYSIRDSGGNPVDAVINSDDYSVDEICVTNKWKKEESAEVEIEFKLSSKVVVKLNAVTQKHSGNKIRFYLVERDVFEPGSINATIQNDKLVEIRLPNDHGL